MLKGLSDADYTHLIAVARNHKPVQLPSLFTLTHNGLSRADVMQRWRKAIRSETGATLDQAGSAINRILKTDGASW